MTLHSQVLHVNTEWWWVSYEGVSPGVSVVSVTADNFIVNSHSSMASLTHSEEFPSFQPLQQKDSYFQNNTAVLQSTETSVCRSLTCFSILVLLAEANSYNAFQNINYFFEEIKEVWSHFLGLVFRSHNCKAFFLKAKFCIDGPSPAVRAIWVSGLSKPFQYCCPVMLPVLDLNENIILLLQGSDVSQGTDVP